MISKPVEKQAGKQPVPDAELKEFSDEDSAIKRAAGKPNAIRVLLDTGGGEAFKKIVPGRLKMLVAGAGRTSLQRYLKATGDPNPGDSLVLQDNYFLSILCGFDVEDSNLVRLLVDDYLGVNYT